MALIAGVNEDRRGRYRRGRLKPLEHQNKVSARQAAQQQVAPEDSDRDGNPATSPRPDHHDHRSEHKAQRRQRSGSDVIGNNIAETKRARDHGRKTALPRARNSGIDDGDRTIWVKCRFEYNDRLLADKKADKGVPEVNG